MPGSHRLPWFEFEPGTIVRRPSASPERVAEWTRELTRTTEEMPVKELTCRRGETFIWHAGLMHGGKGILDRSATRKSFVVHYSTAANYRSRTSRMRVRDGDQWRKVERGTDKVIERPGARGLDNPQHLRRG